MYSKGDSADHVYFVRTGKVAVIWDTPTKRATNFYTKGCWFGEHEARDGTPRLSFCVACADTELFVLDKRGFEGITSDCREGISNGLLGRTMSDTEKARQAISTSFQAESPRSPGLGRAQMPGRTRIEASLQNRANRVTGNVKHAEKQSVWNGTSQTTRHKPDQGSTSQDGLTSANCVIKNPKQADSKQSALSADSRSSHEPDDEAEWVVVPKSFATLDDQIARDEQDSFVIIDQEGSSPGQSERVSRDKSDRPTPAEKRGSDGYDLSDGLATFTASCFTGAPVSPYSSQSIKSSRKRVAGKMGNKMRLETVSPRSKGQKRFDGLSNKVKKL